MNAKDTIVVAEKYPEYQDYLDLGEATEVMGMKHVQYVRRLVHDSVKAVEEGKEPKFPWPEDGRPIAVKLSMGNFDKWFINPDSAAGYEARGTFGSGSGLRRYLIRFNEANHSVEQIEAALQAALGDPGDEGSETWIFEPAYKKGSRKGKKGKPSEPKDFTAEILSSLSKPHPRAGSAASTLD